MQYVIFFERQRLRAESEFPVLVALVAEKKEALLTGFKSVRRSPKRLPAQRALNVSIRQRITCGEVVCEVGVAVA